MIDFMILGAQKAATSSLQHYLMQLDSVFMPDGESPFFESPDIKLKKWDNFGLCDKVNGIKRPDMLCDVVIASNVFENIPHSKFIVVLREPVSRAVSAYYHLSRHLHIDYQELNKGVERCLSHYKNDTNDMYSSVITNGLYGKSLNMWFDKYGSDSFLVLSQVEVRDNLKDVMDRICLFLNLPILNIDLTSYSERNVGFYNELSIKAYRLGHQLKTMPLGDGPRRVERNNKLMRIVGASITGVSNSLGNYFNTPIAKLDNQLKAELDAIYLDDGKKLLNYVDKKIAYWL